MNIVLTGYRCTGKTSIGKLLASRLQLPFYDTDELIQKRAGKTIKEIVCEKGWEAFREEENAVVKELNRIEGSVIAVGGGTIMDAQNVQSLKQNGYFVWLTAEVETIIARLQADKLSGSQRPLLEEEDLRAETERIMVARSPVYKSLADMIVETDSYDIEEIAGKICENCSVTGYKPGGTSCREIR